MSLIFSYFRLQLLSFSFPPRGHVSLVHSSMMTNMPVPVLPWNQFPRAYMCELQHHTEQSVVIVFIRCSGQVVRWQSCKSGIVGSIASHSFSCTVLQTLRDLYKRHTTNLYHIVSSYIFNSLFTAYTKSDKLAWSNLFWCYGAQYGAMWVVPM